MSRSKTLIVGDSQNCPSEAVFPTETERAEPSGDAPQARAAIAAPAAESLASEQILQGMPEAIAVLDSAYAVQWANGRFLEWTGRQSAVGESFYVALGSPEILGPDFCPLHTALSSGLASRSTVRAHDNRYFQVHAVPVAVAGQPTGQLIVSISDVTAQMLQQQKLEAIHRAGIELANLTPDELSQMTVEERIELLKSNILHYTKDLLNYDVVEIRLLDSESGRLEPLLAVGLTPEACSRELLAEPQNNGVTGFVAATGKSYLCEDTTGDPLYLEGCAGAKSSLTVPLVLHDKVIGTFNVESPEPRAFNENDLQFLEIFCRDVAAALNTLELLVAEKAIVAQEGIEAIHSAVALPVDVILNEAVNVMAHYIGHDPAVVERLQNILRNARDIKQLIQRVGRTMAPAQALPTMVQTEERPLLVGKRILVVDADEAVRSAAHNLLERFGCEVETAHDAEEAVCMVRNTAVLGSYDAIIADVRLPDQSGFELFMRLKEVQEVVPMVLMQGFGHDPSHSLVKARQAGLASYAILYKPFRLDQLLQVVERVVQSSDAAPAA